MSARDLLDLDVDTSFAILTLRTTGPRNQRQRFLVNNGYVNNVDLENHDFRISDGAISIDGLSIDDINRDLEEEGLGDLTVLPTASVAKEMREDLDAYEDAGLGMINNFTVQKFGADKAHQNRVFWDANGTVPYYQPTEKYALKKSGAGLIPRETEEGLEMVKEDFDWLEDYKLIVKPRDQSGGDDIKPYDNLGALASEWQDNGIPARSLVQVYMPHEYDLRGILGGDSNGNITSMTAMKRYSIPGDFRCNISQLKGASHDSKVATAIENGHVDPVDMDDVDPGIENALSEHARTIHEEIDSETNFFGGIDFLAVDPDDIDHYPDEIVDVLDSSFYVEEDDLYLVYGEWNNSAGSGIDSVNIDHPHQNSAAQLAGFGDAVSRGIKYDGVPPAYIDEDEILNSYRV